MNRRCLSDQDDVDVILAEGFEKTAGESRDSYHAASFEREKGDVV